MLMNKIELTGYDGLRFAIILSAARDYRRAVRFLKKHDGEESTYVNQMVWLKYSCEKFFRSDWYKSICDIDGEKFIEELPKLGKSCFRDKGGAIRDVF